MSKQEELVEVIKLKKQIKKKTPDYQKQRKNKPHQYFQVLWVCCGPTDHETF